MYFVSTGSFIRLVITAQGNQLSDKISLGLDKYRYTVELHLVTHCICDRFLRLHEKSYEGIIRLFTSRRSLIGIIIFAYPHYANF